MSDVVYSAGIALLESEGGGGGEGLLSCTCSHDFACIT